MNHPILTLRPLTPRDLPGLVAWFEDPDRRRFLGGPDWPAAMLANAERSIGMTFRGAAQTGAHHYLALAGDNPVGYIDCGTFDRSTVYAGEGPAGPIITESVGVATGVDRIRHRPTGPPQRAWAGDAHRLTAETRAGFRGTVRGWRRALEHGVSPLP